MYFHVSNEATILFYSWTTSTAAGNVINYLNFLHDDSLAVVFV